MNALLTIKDLYTWFPIKRGVFSRIIGQVRAVDGVSLEVAPGETLGLVGESGCGKTTLARTVLRLDPARSGSVIFAGHDMLSLSQRQTRKLRKELQIIFQDPYSSLNPRLTVFDIITEGISVHERIGMDARRERAFKLLREVGLDPSALHRYPHEFSGGQRQRISIARALSVQPRLIVCDEAVSALDVSVQAQVINLLMDLRDRHKLSYIFISHDLSVVRNIADRIAVMYLGQLVEVGSTEDVITRPAHPYTRALISAIPRAGEVKRERIVLSGDVPSPAAPPPGCRFHPRCPHATAVCRRDVPPLASHIGKDAWRVACLRKDEI